MPYIDRNDKTPYYLQVYEQIARGIESGLHASGKRLPSIRQCATELGVSNTTIELAYQKLAEEGFIEPRRGSGFYICDGIKQHEPSHNFYSDEHRRDLATLLEATGQRSRDEFVRFDFNYDATDAELFPFAAWARISRDVFLDRDTLGACLYNDTQGLHDFRAQIATYLISEFAIRCVPEQIVVMPTTRNIVQSVLSLFDPTTTIVAMEEPGYNEVRSTIERAGYVVRPIPITSLSSWESFEEALGDANVVFATPAAQFPTTLTMPFDVRRKLIKWAEDRGAFLIDDEYGSLFQLGDERVPSLYALDDKGNTIALGTFSNSFSPALCLSFAVLPPALMLKFVDDNRGKHPQVPWQTQATMASFMAEGHWKRHLGKLRTAVTRKRAAMRASLAAHMGDNVDAISSTGSLYVLVRTHDGRTEDDLIDAAAEARVRVYPTTQYWTGPVPPDWRWVLVGFAGISQDDIEPGIAALAHAWGYE